MCVLGSIGYKPIDPESTPQLALLLGGSHPGPLLICPNVVARARIRRLGGAPIPALKPTEISQTSQP